MQSGSLRRLVKFDIMPNRLNHGGKMKGKNSKEKLNRTTVFLPENLLSNIKACVLASGGKYKSNSDFMVTAARALLIKEGLKPDEDPKISISY